MHVEGNSYVEATANYAIKGNAAYHIGVSHGGNYVMDGHIITCSGLRNGICHCTRGGPRHLTHWTFVLRVWLGHRIEVQRHGQRCNRHLHAACIVFPWQQRRSQRFWWHVLPLAMPTLGACTNGSLTSGLNDFGFQVVFSGASSSCTVNFAVPKAIATVCTASSNRPAVNMGALSSTNFTFVGTFANTNFVNVVCSAY